MSLQSEFLYQPKELEMLSDRNPNTLENCQREHFHQLRVCHPRYKEKGGVAPLFMNHIVLDSTCTAVLKSEKNAR